MKRIRFSIIIFFIAFVANIFFYNSLIKINEFQKLKLANSIIATKDRDLFIAKLQSYHFL